jgi:EpsI family protein
MSTRRDLLILGGCAVGAAAAFGLKPRKRVLLLPKDEKLEKLVPITLPGWTGQDVGDPLALNQEKGTLASRLYQQQVVRLYTDKSGRQVMMLLAYGSQQSDDLQLHRPEICYPAFGFSLTRNQPAQLELARGVDIPARRIVAQNDDGLEYVTYWSRLGEHLPQSGSEQREARFEAAFHGVVPDGVLCRFSTTAPDAHSAWNVIDGLVATLVLAIRPDRRATLIGSDRARALVRV